LHRYATGDWSSILSLGEQQRLAFARLLLAAPPVALLVGGLFKLNPDGVQAMGKQSAPAVDKLNPVYPQLESARAEM
jgi:ABC-type uncharacterized transport system fused permease/ATPase subunit